MYRPFYPYLLALLAVFTCFPLCSDAQHKNFSISPAPDWLAPYKPDLQKTPDMREVSDGYYLLLFEEQYHAERKSQYRHVIRQIVSEAGVQNAAEISVNYDPTYEQLKFHQILVRRNGAVINQLNAGQFKFLQQEKELSRFIYSGLYTAYFIIDDVRKGDQIEYAYSLEGQNPIFEDKYFNTFYLGTSDPIVNFYKNLIAKPARKLQFKSFNHAPLPAKRTLHGMDLYEWNLAQVTTSQKAPYNTPSWYDTYPIVQVSEYTRWEEIVNWALQVNHVQNAITPALQSKITAWQKDAGGSKAAYMQSAVRFVQDDIRYMGIEMGEYSHRPSAPGKILTRRFGDCKDKSLLLCTLLQANDIDANLVYINTEVKKTLEDYLPSPVLFDHTIVHAVLDGKSYWIDPTINYQRGPLSSITVPDYQKALIIKKGNGALSDIPAAQTGITKITESFAIPKNNYKTGRLEVVSSYSDRYADDMRADFAASSIKELGESYLKYYKEIYGEVTADTGVLFTDTARSSNLFEVTEAYTLHHPWTIDTTGKEGQRFYIKAKMLTDLLPIIDTDTLDAPLALRYPYSLDYTLVVHMPEDWPFEDASLHLKNKYYRLDFTSTISRRTVKLHYQYTSYQDHIPAADLPAYKKDRAQIAEYGSFYFSWNEGVNTVNTGSGVSWVMLVLALLFVGIFSYIAMKFYQRSVLPVQVPSEAWDIGGWLFLLGMGVVFRPVALLIAIINTGLLANSTWESIIHAENNQLRVLVLFAELAANTFLWVLSILLVLLFVKRRDTFPATCIVFYVALVLINTFDIIAVNIVIPSYVWDQERWTEYGRSIVFAIIWIPYLLKAERVKRTFVIPHSSALK